MGGGKDGGAIVGAALAKEGVRRLDYLVITHLRRRPPRRGHRGPGERPRPQLHARCRRREPGAAGDDDSDGWDNRQTMLNPGPQELGQGDDIQVMHFIDRGDSGAPNTQTFRKYEGMVNAMVAAESESARRPVNNLVDVEALAIDLSGRATMTCLSAKSFVRGQGARVPGRERGDENVPPVSLVQLLEQLLLLIVVTQCAADLRKPERAIGGVAGGRQPSLFLTALGALVDLGHGFYAKVVAVSSRSGILMMRGLGMHPCGGRLGQMRRSWMR